MTVKRFKVSVLQDDDEEYGLPVEGNLLTLIKQIKFAAVTSYYIESDEVLEIDDKESYTVSRDFFVDGEIKLTGGLGVL